MARYVDTAMKRFPFAQVTRANGFEDDEIPTRRKHKFDFDFYKEKDANSWEDLQEIDEILLKKVDSKLDDLH